MTEPTGGPRADPEDPLLIDASVLVELVIDGDFRVAADRLIDRIVANGDLVVLTVSHGLIEAASALRRLVRRGQVDPATGERSLATLLELDLALDPPASRLARAWQLRDTMTTYDAVYAAAAEAFALPLVTTDSRLLTACRAAGIPARHLSDAFPA